MIHCRTAAVVALAATFLAPGIAVTQEPAAALEELRSRIDAYRATVEAAERGPFPEGSEGALRSELAIATEALIRLEVELADAAEREAVARSEILVLVQNLDVSPAADPEPAPLPESAPVDTVSGAAPPPAVDAPEMMSPAAPGADSPAGEERTASGADTPAGDAPAADIAGPDPDSAVFASGARVARGSDRRGGPRTPRVDPPGCNPAERGWD